MALKTTNIIVQMTNHMTLRLAMHRYNRKGPQTVRDTFQAVTGTLELNLLPYGEWLFFESKKVFKA